MNIFECVFCCFVMVPFYGAKYARCKKYSPPIQQNIGSALKFGPFKSKKILKILLKVTLSI